MIHRTPRAQLRPATPQECAPFAGPHHRTAGFVLEKDGVPQGHVFLSAGAGQIFAHDLEYRGQDPTAACALLLAARKLARRLGAGQLIVHVAEGGERMAAFWTRNGFRPIGRMYVGEI